MHAIEAHTLELLAQHTQLLALTLDHVQQLAAIRHLAHALLQDTLCSQVFPYSTASHTHLHAAVAKALLMHFVHRCALRHVSRKVAHSAVQLHILACSAQGCIS